MKNKKLSVIIPVYNVENYLHECLDSVINQTYSNLEIICVNDGSTDNSLSILEEYAQKDSRIIVINKENGGLSSARNAGLERMSGDLVTFVDSDDKIREDTYTANIACFQQDMELEIAQFPIIFSYTGKNERLFQPISAVLTENDTIFVSTWKGDLLLYSVCNKIFKKEIFKTLGFKDKALYEDMLLTSQYCLNIRKVMISEAGCYFYRWNEGSILVSKSSYKKNKDYVSAQLEFYKQSLHNPLISKKESALYLLKRILWFINYNYAHYSPAEKKEMIALLKPYRITFGYFLACLFDKSVASGDKIHLLVLALLGTKTTYQIYDFYAKKLIFASDKK